jgi:putative ATP-dependent endonuclease of the OLD family
MIRKIYIQNYKIFESFELEFNKEKNILVGDNESGKSTILEAINLALTNRLNGRYIEYELSPYLFNARCVDNYLASLKFRPNNLPEIIIELFFEDIPELGFLKGRMNSKNEDSLGVKIEITFDESYNEEYENLLRIPSKIEQIPIEYYTCRWYSFANRPLTQRLLKFSMSYIDASTIRLQSGADYYLQEIIKSDLNAKERVELNIAYRNLKHDFTKQDSIKKINENLATKKGIISQKDLSLSIDVSQKSNWETNLIPHLDKLPFQYIGKGEQNALKVMLALERKGKDASVILIEEPENHLSYSSMNILIRRIEEKCTAKQIIIATHSTYVLNKLGLSNLILLHKDSEKPVTNSFRLNNLKPDTQNYFKVLSGYDTLRLILSKKVFLVEGPSDELIVQKAYFQKYGKLPMENGIDVINIRGLSFARFLDIAVLLKIDVIVITDNDGDHKKVYKKYSDYEIYSNIIVAVSTDDSAPTLEPQIAKCNNINTLNAALKTNFNTTQEIIDYMKLHKTAVSLKIFEYREHVNIPDYIENAI